MSELPENINELNPSNLQLIIALKEQISNDLAKVGNYSFEDNGFRVENWVSRLSDVLSKMNDHELNHFQYVVDLPENWSKDIRASDNPITELAKAILQREWQKVYFRIKFS